MNLKTKIIPVFLPESKCPFNCVFCSTKTANGENSEFNSLSDLKNQIENSVASIDKFHKNAYKEIAFYGGTFTYGSIEEIEQYLSVAKDYIDNNKVNGIRVSTRPDFFSSDIVSILKKYGVTTVEFGAQSFIDSILKSIKRGHSAKDIENAVMLSKNAGFVTSIHLMCGLPDESEQDFLFSIKETVKLKPNFVRIHPLVVMQNTELAEKGYVAKPCDKLVEMLAKGVWFLERNGIKVIKLGLQPTDSLNSEGVVLSGCYHQSLKHLVYSHIFKTMLEKIATKYGFSSKITVCESDFSYLTGYKKSNCDILNRFLNVERSNILNNNEIIVNDIKLNIMSEELYEIG